MTCQQPLAMVYRWTQTWGNALLCVCVCVCVWCVCVCLWVTSRKKKKPCTEHFWEVRPIMAVLKETSKMPPKYTETMMLIVSWPQLDQKPFFKKSFRKTQSFFAKQLCANNRKTLHVIDTKHCRYGQALSSDGKITWKKTASIINKEELNYYACWGEIKKSIRDKKRKNTVWAAFKKSYYNDVERGHLCF